MIQGDKMANYLDNKNRRSNYYNDQLLTEDELNVEQHYHTRMRGLQNASFYGCGILEGLTVEQIDDSEPLKIRITKGKAIVHIEDESGDLIGKEIVFLNDEEVDLSGLTFESNTGNLQSIFVAISPLEVLEGMDPLKDFLDRVETYNVNFHESKDLLSDSELLLAEIKVNLDSDNSNGPQIEIFTSDRRYGGLDVRRANLNKVEFDVDHSRNLQRIKPLASIEGEGTDSLIFKAGKVEVSGLDSDLNCAVKGPVEVRGDLTIEGDLKVTGNSDTSQVVINASQLFIKDNIITLNKPLENEGPKDISGIEIYNGNNSRPSILSKINEDGTTLWQVHDGQKEGKLAIGLPPDITNGERADDYHHHSILTDSGNNEACVLDESGDLHIGQPGTDDAGTERLNVYGITEVLDGNIVFADGKVQHSLKSLFYTHIFEPTGDPVEDTGILKNLIGSNRIILIANNVASKDRTENNDAPNELTIVSTIEINGINNLKIIAAESVTINSTVPTMMFTLSGVCTNIEFNNMQFRGKTGLCQVSGGPVNKLTIKYCRKSDWGDSSPEDSENGFLLKSENSSLSNINITDNRWFTRYGGTIDIQNSSIKDLEICDNTFIHQGNVEEKSLIHIHSQSAEDIVNSIDVSRNRFEVNTGILFIKAERAEDITVIKNSVVIDGPKENKKTTYAVLIENAKNIISSENTITIKNLSSGNSIKGLYINGSECCRVTGNIIKISPASDDAITISGSNYIIKNNIFQGQVQTPPVAGINSIFDKNMVY